MKMRSALMMALQGYIARKGITQRDICHVP